MNRDQTQLSCRRLERKTSDSGLIRWPSRFLCQPFPSWLMVPTHCRLRGHRILFVSIWTRRCQNPGAGYILCLTNWHWRVLGANLWDAESCSRTVYHCEELATGRYGPRSSIFAIYVYIHILQWTGLQWITFSRRCISCTGCSYRSPACETKTAGWRWLRMTYCSSSS